MTAGRGPRTLNHLAHGLRRAGLAFVDGICRAADVALTDVEIHVITAPTVRLDVEADRRSLEEKTARRKVATYFSKQRRWFAFAQELAWS